MFYLVITTYWNRRGYFFFIILDGASRTLVNVIVTEKTQIAMLIFEFDVKQKNVIACVTLHDVF